MAPCSCWTIGRSMYRAAVGVGWISEEFRDVLRIPVNGIKDRVKVASINAVVGTEILSVSPWAINASMFVLHPIQSSAPNIDAGWLIRITELQITASRSEPAHGEIASPLTERLVRTKGDILAVRPVDFVSIIRFRRLVGATPRRSKLTCKNSPSKSISLCQPR